jgi:hypothetical protein
MDEDFIDEIPIADEYLSAIGRLMVNWNQLDGLFDLLLIRLMGCRLWDVRSHMVIVGMNFGTKVELVKSLAGVQMRPDDPIYMKLINTTLPRITHLQSQRNAVAHNKWALGEGGVRGVRMTAKGKLKITEKLVPIEDLKKDSKEMLVMMNEVFVLLPRNEFSDKFSA